MACTSGAYKKVSKSTATVLIFKPCEGLVFECLAPFSQKTWTMLITLILHKLSRTFLLNDMGKYLPGVHGCGENPGGRFKSQTVNYTLCSCTPCLPTQYLLQDCLWYSWIQILSYDLASTIIIITKCVNEVTLR